MTDKMASTSFYFIRHGQTEENRCQVAYRKDAFLNEQGRAQALFLAPYVASLPIQTICYSPLRRTKQTMELATQGLEKMQRVPIEELGECMAKTWYAMVEAGADGPFCPHVQAFFRRVTVGIQKVFTHEGPVLLIAHGGVHWALCQQWGIVGHKWKIANGEVVHFRPLGEGRWEAELVMRPFCAL